MKDFRTLIRVDRIEDHEVEFCIPGWNPHLTLMWNDDQFPENIRDLLCEDLRFFARVPIGAEDANDLYIKDAERPDSD